MFFFVVVPLFIVLYGCLCYKAGGNNVVWMLPLGAWAAWHIFMVEPAPLAYLMGSDPRWGVPYLGVIFLTPLAGRILLGIYLVIQNLVQRRRPAS